MFGKYYEHRDGKGVLKAMFDSDTAKEITWNLSGKWRDYKAKGSEKTRCYEFNSDGWLTLRGTIRIYFWEGDMLIEKGL